MGLYMQQRKARASNYSIPNFTKFVYFAPNKYARYTSSEFSWKIRSGSLADWCTFLARTMGQLIFNPNTFRHAGFGQNEIQIRVSIIFQLFSNLFSTKKLSSHALLLLHPLPFKITSRAI